MVGTVQRREWGGRPENVYCAYRLKQDWLEHDDRLTDVFEALGWPKAERGYSVPMVPGTYTSGKKFEIRPDARTLSPKPRWWEMHCGTEERAVIERKVAAYRGKETAVLFVALSDRQRQTLIEWCQPIADVAFFAVLSELLADPTGKVWMTANGTRVNMTF